MGTRFFEDAASGGAGQELEILGHFPQGRSERYILLEEPDEPIWFHYSTRFKRKFLHYRERCDNCGIDHMERPKPCWFIGAITPDCRRFGPLELTQRCFRSLDAGRRGLEPELDDEPSAAPCFGGIEIEISRADFESSPYILRVLGRREVKTPWPYHTRRWLAERWNVPLKPRIYKEA